jgi:hypothetical protein
MTSTTCSVETTSNVPCEIVIYHNEDDDEDISRLNMDHFAEATLSDESQTMPSEQPFTRVARPAAGPTITGTAKATPSLQAIKKQLDVFSHRLRPDFIHDQYSHMVGSDYSAAELEGTIANTTEATAKKDK